MKLPTSGSRGECSSTEPLLWFRRSWLKKLWTRRCVTKAYHEHKRLSEENTFIVFVSSKNKRAAHLRKRSKVTMEPIIENPRGII